MTFEPTITVGALFTIASTIIGVFVTCLFFGWSLRGKIDNLDGKVDSMGIELTGVRKILEVQARQDERLLALQKQVDELRHGEGMVLPLRPAQKVY